MIFQETALSGAFLIQMETSDDERGFFGRLYCRQDFAPLNFPGEIVQSNVSYNRKRATLRGMHYQAEPFAEAKIVACMHGAFYDVIIDLRQGSPTYKRWTAAEISAVNKRCFYIPEGFAHGFQTLEDDTTILYMMSQYYQPEYARGVRWDDPAFGIKWPFKEPLMSEKDRLLPDFTG